MRKKRNPKKLAGCASMLGWIEGTCGEVAKSGMTRMGFRLSEEDETGGGPRLAFDNSTGEFVF